MNQLQQVKNEFIILKQSSILKKPNRLYESSEQQLKHVIDKLEMLNPLSILGRGYAISYQENHLVKKIEDVKVGELLQIRMQDGIVNTKVLSKEGLKS